MKVEQITLDKIEVDPNQPRKIKPDEYLAELGNSIKTRGQLQSIRVRNHPEKEGMYMIVVGECRYRACVLVGMETIDAVIVDYKDENEVFIDQLLENIARLDMTPMEEIEGIERALIKGVSLGKLANAIGKSAKTIEADLKLCSLPPEMKKAVDAGELPKEVARTLAEYPANQVRTAWKWAMKNPKNVKTMMAGIFAYDQENNKTAPMFAQVVKEAVSEDIAKARKASERLQKVIANYATKWGSGKNSLLVVASRKKNINELELMASELIRQGELLRDNLRKFKAEKGITEEKPKLRAVNG